MFIFPYFREHVANVHGSHIRQRIIMIRTGVVVRDVITNSIRWLLFRILSGILFEILLLLSVMVFRSTASIWSIGKSLTFSGVLLFGMYEEFSFMFSSAFGVPAKMVCAQTVSSKYKTTFWMPCSLLPRFDLSFAKNQHY